jgi:hypothetical protein
MFAARSSLPLHLYTSYGQKISPRRPIGYGQQIAQDDVVWKRKWPFITSTIIGVLMIICTIVIGGLEIASLAISTDQGYGKTTSLGTGLWCGSFFLIAAVLILVISK